MKTILCICIFLSVTGHMTGQENTTRRRTPKDYLLLANGGYDRQKDKQNGAVILKIPEHFKRLTNNDLDILDENGFYKDNSGYAGAVFMDTRDHAIIISHRGTELDDLHDILADVQIINKTYPVQKSILPNRFEIGPKTASSEVYKQIIDKGIQYPSAKKLVDAVFKKFPGHTIEQTGHSLGGSHVQRLSYEYNTKGVTFDSAGIGSDECFDAAKKGNADKITNYKIYNSIVSSPLTTGKNIGKTITIYPTENGRFLGTSAHGVLDIYQKSINHTTGDFKTEEEAAEEVAKYLWEKNEPIYDLLTDKSYNRYKAPRKTTIQDRYKGDFDAFKRYIREKIRDTPSEDSPDQNSVQFCHIDTNTTDGGHTLQSIGEILLFDNAKEAGTYQILKHRDKWYIVINRIDFPRINPDFWNNEFKRTEGTYRFKNRNAALKSRNEVISDRPRTQRGL